MLTRKFILVSTALAVCAGCTVVKPITCAVVHPIRSVGALFDESSAETDEVDDTPTAVALVEFPILVPVFFVYKSFVGVIGGLGTGLVSDFNVVSGHASWDKTLDNLTRPDKTNAAR
jgi:hypothetical protein